jgi:hypothetical protein
MPSPSSNAAPTVAETTTYASLSSNCKRVYMRLACYAVTKVGLALQERTTKSATEIYRESVSDFVQLNKHM